MATTDESFQTDSSAINDLDCEQLYLEVRLSFFFVEKRKVKLVVLLSFLQAANILQQLQSEKPMENSWNLDDMEGFLIR